MPPKQLGSTLVASASALLLCASSLAAQVQVIRVDDLRFGNVIAGVAKTVLHTDASAAGRYDLVAPRKSSMLIQFTLPVVMTGPGGATMPISFAGTTAGYSDVQSIASQVGFSPATGTLQTKNKDGLASVFLGGTVTPGPAQAAGSYTANITLTLTVF